MENMNRRSFIKAFGLGVAGLITGSILNPVRQAFGAKLVDKTHPMYTPLNYAIKSTKKGQNCLNCLHYQGAKGSKQGACAMFQGVEVHSGGWCSAWSKKA